MNKRPALRALCALLALALTLGGCAAPGDSAPSALLPSPRVPYQAPEGDGGQTYEETVTLYLPSLDGASLVAVPRLMLLSAARRNEGAVCQALFDHQGTDSAGPLSQTPLSLASGSDVEVSGGVATVDLSASALQLNHRELYTVSQAIANTLCQFEDIQYVNILVNGVQPGLDVASRVPMGGLQMKMPCDLATLWEQATASRTGGQQLSSRRFSAVVTLYYPAAMAKGVLCEARTLSFSGQTAEQMLLTLLEALSAGPAFLTGLPVCPLLTQYLTEPPSVEEAAVTGERKAVLYFDDALNEALIQGGVTRSVMMAALTRTLTTFLPALQAVEVHIGQERIDSLAPSGLYGGSETIVFENGLMRRDDFNAFLLAQCDLYFTGGEGTLTLARRPIPYYEAHNARFMLSQLMLGPQPFDDVSGLAPSLPVGLRDADLLGVSLANGVMCLNFTGQLLSLCQGMAEDGERRMVYAIVNTLCQLRPVRKLCFFIAGQQPETFAGALYLPGYFMENPDILTD